MKNKNDELKLKYAIDFIEELSWILDSRKNIDLKEIPKLLRSLQNEDENINKIKKRYSSTNPNIHFLIGVLPRLFQDELLFPKNDDIANFAIELLGITEIKRIEKRSRYELIGMIVCKVTVLDDQKLDLLVSTLMDIVDDQNMMNKVRNEKKDIGFSWNDFIRKMNK